MELTTLRGLLPLHSTPTLTVSTVLPDAPLSEVAERLVNEELGLLLVVGDDLTLQGAVRADTVLRLAARLPTLPVRSLPLGRVARAEAPATRGKLSALLGEGDFLAVLVGANDGSIVFTSEEVTERP